MDKLNVFVPITKIDEEKRLVYGVLAEEAPDKSGEIFDYATSKSYVQAWSDSFKKATASTGQEPSAGNLRSMHTEKSAGKFVSVDFDDVAKTVPVCAEVVDDQEWEKTKKGVYTGFSIGGGYVKRWKDDALGKVRYTASLAEGSLVDNPCMYGATFTAVKAEGAQELRKFVGATDSPVEKAADTTTETPAAAVPAGDLAKAEESPMTPEALNKIVEATVDAVTKALAPAMAPVNEEIKKLQSATTPEALIKAVQDGVAKTITETLTKSFNETVAKAVEPLAKAADVTAISDRVKKLEDAPAPVGNPVDKSLGVGAGEATTASKMADMVNEALVKAKAEGASDEMLKSMRLTFATKIATLGR